MLRAAYWLVLSVLVLMFLGVFLLFATFRSIHVGPVTFGYGDGFEMFYVSVRRYVEREKTGYTALPHYYPPRHNSNGYFAAWNETSGFEPWQSGTCDFAHWPNGDPGLGPNNPLPPLVKRVWRRNFDTANVFLVHATVFLAWGSLGFVRWWLRRRDRPLSSRPGFEITPSAVSSNPRSCPAAYELR